MKIRNIYNQTTAPTIQDLWLYKGDLRYFGNKGWTSLSPDYTKNFEDIATQIDEINKQLDTIESTTADIGVLADKIGSNTYTDANYISKETNLTDAALQLDEEIKATNDNLAILNAATIKGVKVGNNTTNEGVASGVVTISNADGTKDGTISKEVYNNLNTYNAVSSDHLRLYRDSTNEGLGLQWQFKPLTSNSWGASHFQFPEATTTANGLMSTSDKTKLDSIISTGDGTKFLADDFTYKTIQMPDLSTYATKSELSGYLPLSGGEMTGNLSVPQVNNLSVIKFSPSINPGAAVHITANNGILTFFSNKDDNNGTILFMGNKIQTSIVPEVVSGSEFLPLYYSGNFQAGVDYVAPSALDSYLPLSGGTMTGNLALTTGSQLSASYINMGLNAVITGSDNHFLLVDNNQKRIDVGNMNESLRLRTNNTDLEHWRETNTSIIYDSGNFIAGTDYLAPGGVSIADVSGLQDSLDGKVNTTGDSYKNNNACWGGTRPNGTQTCLLYIDTNGNNKLSNCYGGTYLRASAPHTLFLEVGTPGSMDDSVFYSIYNEGNFKAGTNYVAPSTLNNYLPLSGGTLTGLLNLDITSVTSTSYNEGIRISEAANGWSTLVLGTNGSSSGSTSTQFSIARNPANTLVIVSSSNTSLSETSTVTPTKGLGITQDNTDLTFNGNHVITKADTFNTITYTTSASEENLRAWNNYINGYVGNLKISDSSYTEILMSTGVNQTSKVVYATQFSVAEGTSSFTLNVLSYTIADDGSVTKTMNSGTISSGGAN